ncbi:hypothetical protein SNOG_11339 [Parastagonospora nodorum SN15]|uniref:Uncharacterized protein n=1 Tax=Phaeosphaeria nodorum (strain SN15 / ATCC MYA-4574 / FGSC 10173) TaxID=321614 RepID=Q0UA75_PHANO|nr:hypothetical protein SNOG_11339 [Parastagonospora nodorum SN15]EAT81047.1 hypothetical protein SNOG_11339 [Parastagonospora nodorum SN15]
MREKATRFTSSFAMPGQAADIQAEQNQNLLRPTSTNSQFNHSNHSNI